MRMGRVELVSAHDGGDVMRWSRDAGADADANVNASAEVWTSSCKLIGAGRYRVRVCLA